VVEEAGHGRLETTHPTVVEEAGHGRLETTQPVVHSPTDVSVLDAWN
jgi:hypothetical protein